MESKNFIDFYEVLEVSPKAKSVAIERRFRSLARRYLPVYQASGDRA